MNFKTKLTSLTVVTLLSLDGVATVSDFRFKFNTNLRGHGAPPG